MINNNFSVAVSAEVQAHQAAVIPSESEESPSKAGDLSSQKTLLEMTATLQDRVFELANALKLPIASPDSKEYPYLLLVTSNRLELKTTQTKNIQTVYVDFLSAKQKYRQKNHPSELLIKALGRLDPSALIVDATAGFGEDGFLLASKGHRVILLERAPIFAALLRDGLARLYQSAEHLSHISLELVEQDAKIYLPELAKQREIAVVYLDPMFPERKKAALSRKEMEILRKLVGGDVDANELLRIALGVATQRVVVKRPRLAEPLAGIKPTFSLTGKISRFDVYLTPLVRPE